jgi:hypothetical protein
MGAKDFDYDDENEELQWLSLRVTSGGNSFRAASGVVKRDSLFIFLTQFF